MLKRDTGDGSTVFCMFMSYIVIFVGLFFFLMTYNTNQISLIKENVNNALIESNLSASITDSENYSYYYDKSNNKLHVFPYLDEINKTYDKYSETLKTNLSLSSLDDKVYTPKSGTKFDKIISKMSVLDYVLFNTYYNKDGTAYITAQSLNGWRVLEFNNSTGFYELTNKISPAQSQCELGRLKTPDGAIITTPSVYSKISFDIKFGFIKETKTLDCENTISLILTS